MGFQIVCPSPILRFEASSLATTFFCGGNSLLGREIGLADTSYDSKDQAKTYRYPNTDPDLNLSRVDFQKEGLTMVTILRVSSNEDMMSSSQRSKYE
jgi:hypothetical protein